jgi:hypothetical protein
MDRAMRDLVSEMAVHHRQFRTGIRGIRPPRPPTVHRAPAWNGDLDTRSEFWTIHRLPLPPASGRSDPTDRYQERTVRRRNLGVLCTLEWLGLLGPPRRQKVMAEEIDFTAFTVSSWINRILVRLGATKQHYRDWPQLPIPDDPDPTVRRSRPAPPDPDVRRSVSRVLQVRPARSRAYDDYHTVWDYDPETQTVLLVRRSSA